MYCFPRCPWSDLDFLAAAEDTGEGRATGDTSFQIVDFSSGFLDLKGLDDDETWVRGEISDRDGGCD
jgi:hypothetical protein